MDSTSKVEEALKLLLEEGRTFVLMVQSDSGNLTYYSNNQGDKLYLVGQEDQ